MRFQASSAGGVLTWYMAGGATGGAVLGLLTMRFGLKGLTIAVLVLSTVLVGIFGQTPADLGQLAFYARAGEIPEPVKQALREAIARKQAVVDTERQLNERNAELAQISQEQNRIRENLRTVVRNFLPALTSRGVVQISAYVDLLIATFLPSGAPAAINYAQTLYNLPVSLFGMSVSAAELPSMSGSSGDETDRAERLRERLRAGLRQIAFFVVPSVGAFIALGHVISAALFQTGRFSRADSTFVWQILAAAAVGLLASTLARLYSSTFFALQDARTPMRFAVVRVTVGVVLGVLLAVVVPRVLGIDPNWGAPGLALAGSLAAWLEYSLLRRALVARIGAVPHEWPFLRCIWTATLVSAALAWLVLTQVAELGPIVVAALVLGTFLLCYVGIARALKVPEAQRVLARIGLKPPK